MDRCIAEEACHAMTFKRPDKMCYLKDQAEDFRNSPDRIGRVTGAKCGAHEITSPPPVGTYPVLGLLLFIY